MSGPDVPKLAREFSLPDRFNGDVRPSEFPSLHLITDDPEVPAGFHGRSIRGVPGECAPECYLLGLFRYTRSSDGRTFIRFYDERNKLAAKYEFKASPDTLRLRDTGGNHWFEMSRDRNKGESCDDVDCAQDSSCLPVNGCEPGAAGCRMVCQ